MKYAWPGLNPSLAESIARGRVLEEARILIGRPELTSAAQIDALLAEIAGAPPAGAPAWTSITGKPSTIAGYAISDAFTQAAADALYSALAHTHTFASITSPPTTLSGYGITDAYTKTASDANYPTKAGVGASGTWGISVSGAAATAGVVTTAAQPNITSITGPLTVASQKNAQVTWSTSPATGALADGTIWIQY